MAEGTNKTQPNDEFHDKEDPLEPELSTKEPINSQFSEHSCKEECPELSSVKTCHHSPGFGPQISQMKPKEHSMRAEDQEASQSQDTELASSPALLQSQGVVCTDGWAGSTSDQKCVTGTQAPESFTSLRKGLTSFL